MMRQSYTLKRIDPWSVLKFAALTGVVLFFIITLAVGFVWYILNSFDLIDRGCDVALDVGFANCDITAGVVFRATALIAGLIAVVHTAVLVFAAFLYNLIAELTGGIGVQLSGDGKNVVTPAEAKDKKKTTKRAQQDQPASSADISAQPPANPAPSTPVNPPNTAPPPRPTPPANPSGGMQRDELFD